MATVKSPKDKKILFVLEQHWIHTKRIQVRELDRENGVFLISTAAHTTPRLLPHSLIFFQPLLTHFNQGCEKRLRAHPGGTISQFEVSDLLGEGCGRNGTVMNGSEWSGIRPLNIEKSSRRSTLYLQLKSTATTIKTVRELKVKKGLKQRATRESS
jgi:hypothetical protein